MAVILTPQTDTLTQAEQPRFDQFLLPAWHAIGVLGQATKLGARPVDQNTQETSNNRPWNKVPSLPESIVRLVTG
ncbi:hypothetical protein VFPPC_18708 [Pochonia chlamydosporia 170]|uniref:Uncharacterized protein n=1 Tax=Pochonia chlamydosporia 170 TaxID=1380566 RepID=A0A219ATQ9_METCM|nr:hypothetical protein VFPPC_18708 [Pochonia chlamydosporia 170]OWT43565.1 hypothetical protein VFPPC_18708 [Pochonia chlamydosporia 170]